MELQTILQMSKWYYKVAQVLQNRAFYHNVGQVLETWGIITKYGRGENK